MKRVGRVLRTPSSFQKEMASASSKTASNTSLNSLEGSKSVTFATGFSEVASSLKGTLKRKKEKGMSLLNTVGN